jgi:hypothetical protein
MPYSDNSNIEWTKWLLNELKPKSILDVGPGAGKYGLLAKEVLPDVELSCIEVWEPYITEFNLLGIYSKPHIGDVRFHKDFKYDLVILGDVLEHMALEESATLWELIKSQAKAAMISIPIVHFPQGHEHGNPYEEHIVDNWTHESVMSTFTGITGYRTFDITGSYVAEFTR